MSDTVSADASRSARRKLRFSSFDEVIVDVRQLELGYEQLGNWTLGQCADHLARFMRFSLDGFPGRRLPQPIAGLLRRVMLSPKKLAQPFPEGMPAPRFLLPTVTVEDPSDSEQVRRADHDAVARLVEQCKRVKHHGGEFFPSPLFGRLPPAVWRQLHLNHCSHHLGFLVPANLGVRGMTKPE